MWPLSDASRFESINIFTASAHWANWVIELQCLSVCPCVCLSVYPWRRKTPSSRGHGDLRLKGVSLVLVCNDTILIYIYFALGDLFFFAFFTLLGFGAILLWASLLWIMGELAGRVPARTLGQHACITIQGKNLTFAPRHFGRSYQRQKCDNSPYTIAWVGPVRPLQWKLKK